MTLEFQHAGAAKALPENYLPAALPAMMGQPVAETYPLLPAPVEGPAEDAATEVLRAVTHAAGTALADPSQVAAAMQDGLPRFIGPPMRPQEDPLGDLAMAGEETDEGAVVTVLGLIDVGIAFWNPGFRTGGQSCFKDIGYLGFAGAGSGPGRSGVRFLGSSALDAICQQADSDGHDRDIVADLAAQYPQSVFGAHPVAGQLYRIDGFNHGTAIADLMLNPQGDGARTVAPHRPIFGLDLPQDVLLDASGGTLQAVLPLAIRALARRVLDWGRQAHRGARLELRLAVPFAFTGGGMGGTHPVIETIRQVVDRAARRRFAIKVFLPAGNHMQDQLHARPGDPQAGTSSEPLRWFLPPDDHSPNTVEFTWQGGGSHVLEIDGPPGRAVVTLDHKQVALLREGGRVIGAAWCRDQGNGWTRLRISLGPTASDLASGLRLACGDWTLRVKPGAAITDLGAWILRDDRMRLDRKSPPARQSRFRDTGYRRKDANGYVQKTDDPGSLVKRVGSISVLAAAQNADLVAVGAQERLAAGLTPAWYGGLSAQAGVPACHEVVDGLRPSSGIRALVNGGGRRMRFSGTSAATALAAVR